MTRLLPPLALSLLLSAASGAAVAQGDGRRLVKAGAEGRFEMQIDTVAGLKGHAPGDVAAFRARVDEIVARLRAMPAVSAPPFPACSRLASWLSRNDIEPVLAGIVSVHTPEVSRPGQCDAKSEMSVTIAINTLTDFLPPAHMTPAGRDGAWYVLDVERRGDGFVVLRGDRIVFFERGRSPFRPVSTERYARRQLADITSNGAHDGGELGALYRQAIASWSPAQRALPACVNDPAEPIDSLDDVVVRPHDSCPPDRAVVEIDDAYLDRSRPAIVQMIAASRPARASLESDHSWALRSAVWSTLDHAFLREQIGR